MSDWVNWFDAASLGPADKARLAGSQVVTALPGFAVVVDAATVELGEPVGGGVVVLLEVIVVGARVVLVVLGSTNWAAGLGCRRLTLLDDPCRPRQSAFGTNPPPAPARTTVTLKPGAKASFSISGMGFNAETGKSCPTSSAILVIPPNTTQQPRVSLKLAYCFQTYSVAPGVFGMAGSGLNGRPFATKL